MKPKEERQAEAIGLGQRQADEMLREFPGEKGVELGFAFHALIIAMMNTGEPNRAVKMVARHFTELSDTANQNGWES